MGCAAFDPPRRGIRFRRDLDGVDGVALFCQMMVETER